MPCFLRERRFNPTQRALVLLYAVSDILANFVEIRMLSEW